MVVHVLNKDISYDSKLNGSKNLSFWCNIFKFGAFKMFKFHNDTPRFLHIVLINDIALLLDLFGNSEGTKGARFFTSSYCPNFDHL